MEARWPLVELTRRCGEALAAADLRQENGQVAEVPNARAIRWYTSTGLLARPEQRGRIAYYGPRHLEQLVAIKRLQANGLPLAAVQSALFGKSDAEVAVVAAVPAELLAVDDANTVTVPDDVSSRAFWSADVADAVVDALPDPGPAPAPTSPAPRVAVDVGPVTVIIPIADDRHLPALRAAVARFAHDLVARGLLVTPPASVPTTPAKENEQ
jgi:DNA-binding transcriptional MerR regulator